MTLARARCCLVAVLLCGASVGAAYSLTKQPIQRVVQQHAPAIKRCYEAALEAHPDIGGKLIARWEVLADGRTNDVRATGVHPEVERCVADEIRTWRFPAGNKPFRLSYPFLMSRRP